MNILANETARKRDEIDAVEKKLLRYYTLKGVSEALSVALTLEDVNELIVEKTRRTLGKAGRVLLYLVDASRQELELFASRNAGKVKEKKGDIFDRWVLKHRKPLMIEDVAKDFRFPADGTAAAGEAFRSLIATPLVTESRVIGILRMDSPSESEYAQDDLRLLDIMSDLGAVAVQNALLYSKTQELARTDSLTGLAVRRYFMERFREDLKRAARSKGTLSILMFDIDRFKDYNDKYGHAVGDLILRHVSRIIRSMVREGDIVARYGGEEMVLLLFGADRKKASADAETIRKMIERQPLILRRQSIDITASIGVAAFPEDAAVEEELLKTADERLYKAKAKGRNMVCAD
jgi:diguanylate cyclase (GGDEF)-like protein